MTKKVNITNLKEIKVIKFRCKNCGTAMECPISPNLNEKHFCPQCNVAMPEKFQKALSCLNQSLLNIDALQKIDNDNFEIELITEIEI